MTRQRGDGSVRLRGHIWQIRYSYRGKRIEESSGSTRRADAVKLLRKRHGEIGAGRFIGPDAERTTFEDLAAMLEADYTVNGRRSIDRARQALDHLREVFALYRAVEITPDRLDAYVETRLKRGAARATVKNELAALRRAFRLALRAARCPACRCSQLSAGAKPGRGSSRPTNWRLCCATFPSRSVLWPSSRT